jgi:outer membrane protein OmpA-like peptidoglycan-associated protein
VAAATDRTVFENGALKFYFATGSAKISADAQDLAAPLLAAAKEGKKLRISGYNDATGDAESNEWLAKKRAQAVRTFLNKQGVSKSQLELVKPEANTSQSGNMAQDRRVEVTIAE